MLYNSKRKKLYRRILIGGAMCAAGLGVFSCSDTYDLDTEQPSGLNSIYGYLEQQGNYSITMQLIEDLGEKEVLSKTGSKTLFVADDDAFKAFFASNSWGVKNYGELSSAQKRLLLHSAMIDNPFTTSMLATAEGPVKGEVCRRASSVTLYDSVLAVKSDSPEADAILPSNERFDQLRAQFDSIVLFTDNSLSAPLLTFTEKFLTSNKVQSTDIDFVYNNPEGTRETEDVYINNAKVVGPNIFCKNGFIHKVDRVIMPLDNMAEVIRKNPQMSIYSGILERFASPSYSRTNSESYRTSNGSSIDSVFVKRYFSDRTYGSSLHGDDDVKYEKDDNGVSMDGSLKYDPGWNGYVPAVANSRDGMQEDMGVMLVPTDAAINEWWNNGDGAVIKDFYGTIEATPSSVLDDLVRVNQLVSFIQAVPTRFADVLNDANEPLGITAADVDSVFLACNGLVYMTNKVFSPTSYSSVLYPAVVDTTQFKKIENAINILQYEAYLNSMVARYILLLPTNNGLLTYIDPVSYGRTGADANRVQVWEINFDPLKSASAALTANVYDATMTDDGAVQKIGDPKLILEGGINSPNYDVKNAIKDRFEDLLDNIIVTEAYQPGKKYYKTKGNTYVRVDGNTVGSKVYGSQQQDANAPLPVSQVYNMENGTTLVLDGVPMATPNSVVKVLKKHPETFSEFSQLLEDANAIYTRFSTKKDTKEQAIKNSWIAGDQTYGNLFNLKEGGTVGAEATSSKDMKATYLLNNYHYTLYAPTNAAMQEAYSMGLPTHDDLIAAEEWDAKFNSEYPEKEDKLKAAAAQGCCPGDSAARIREVMLDFLKYHIQDNSLFLDQGFSAGEYYSGKTALIKASGSEDRYTPARPYRIKVENISSAGMTIKDYVGHERHVETANGLYNMMAREYWYQKPEEDKYNSKVFDNSIPTETYLDNSSFVVIHAIDGPLIYADGEHLSTDGKSVEPTQFKYIYKPLAIE